MGGCPWVTPDSSCLPVRSHKQKLLPNARPSNMGPHLKNFIVALIWEMCTSTGLEGFTVLYMGRPEGAGEAHYLPVKKGTPNKNFVQLEQTTNKQNYNMYSRKTAR